jgi:hypothetical protein
VSQNIEIPLIVGGGIKNQSGIQLRMIRVPIWWSSVPRLKTILIFLTDAGFFLDAYKDASTQIALEFIAFVLGIMSVWYAKKENRFIQQDWLLR